MNTFWLNDLSVLFNKNHFFEIIPFTNLKFNDKLNAIFRLSIYYFIVIALIKKNIKNIIIPIFIGIITIMLYNYYKKLNNLETNNNGNNNVNNNVNINNNVNNNGNNNGNNGNNMNGELVSDNNLYMNDSGVPGCKMPTKDNPFMNPTLLDYSIGNLQQSCPSYNNNIIKDLEKINFNDGLYRDPFDIYDKKHSQREFYSNPIKSIMNDQGAFANWCYGRPPTCKEGNGIQCAANLSGIQGGSKGI